MNTASKYNRVVWFGILWVWLLTGCFSHRSKLPFADPHLVRLTGRVQRAVVTITTYDMEKKPIGIGSGFFVDRKGHLITNYHVLRGAYTARVKIHDGNEFPVHRVLAHDKAADLIKVKVEIPEDSVRPVKVIGAVPAIAERILVVGSPLGLDQTVSEGIVSAVREFHGIGKIFQMSAPVSQGSSGSPVINMDGRVIGVVSFISVPGQNLNFAVAGESVLGLKDAEAARTMSEWTYSVSKEKSRLAAKLCARGFEFSVRGKYKKALEYFQEAVTKTPDNAEAWYGLGNCYAGLEQPAAAIEAFKEALRSSPEKAEAYYHIGRYYHRLGHHQEAIDSYQTAITINRDYGPAYLGLAEIYSNQGRLTDEKEAVEQLLRLLPHHAASHFNLGITYGKLGRYQEAIDAYQRALAIDAEIPQAYYYMGIMYGNLGKANEEFSAYKASIRIDPDFAPAHFNIGVYYINAGRRDAALEQYKILKVLDKDLAENLFNRIYR